MLLLSCSVHSFGQYITGDFIQSFENQIAWTQDLEEIVVTTTGVSRAKQSAFNVVVADTKGLQNTTKSLSQTLSTLPGIRLRESGGVGSENQIMLDGFSGKHIKVFIDGVPQEGAGTGFSLNNLPVGYAERIEVYKGVVPVGFGTDAIGGVINVVTKKHAQRYSVDASYAFGSFHTHKSRLIITCAMGSIMRSTPSRTIPTMIIRSTTG